MNPIWKGCPNSNYRQGRPYGFHPEAIVAHIMDGSFAAGESVFRDPSTQKSAHYGISKAGEVHQYVDENDTAFHAGVVINPTWPLLKDKVNPNFYTIGIEHEGRPDDVWPAEQLAASAALIGQIAARWSIPLDTLHVIRHHQIRASKTCPGNWVDLGNLLALVPASAPPTPPAITSVRTLKSVYLRIGGPNTASPIREVLPPDTMVTVSGFTVGENVFGNAYWYSDGQGNFLWAGATSVPVPAPARAGMVIASVRGQAVRLGAD